MHHLTALDIRDSQIDDQITVINKAYKKAGIQWKLADTTRTKDADWFNAAGPDKYASLVFFEMHT